jgi:multicomponent K+:H+ antiporter subunit C
MEFLLATALGVITSCGVFLLLRGRTFSVMLGLSLLAYAVNLFIFSMGRVLPGAPPVITANAAAYTDPLPQALVLTAIVIGFGMTAFFLGLAVRASRETGSDHVDGHEPSRRKEEAS